MHFRATDCNEEKKIKQISEIRHQSSPYKLTEKRRRNNYNWDYVITTDKHLFVKVYVMADTPRRFRCG